MLCCPAACEEDGELSAGMLGAPALPAFLDNDRLLGVLPLVHLAMGTMPAMPWGSPLSRSAVGLVFLGGKGDCLENLPQGEELCQSFGTSSSSALQDILILLGHGYVPSGGKGHPALLLLRRRRQ